MSWVRRSVAFKTFGIRCRRCNNRWDNIFSECGSTLRLGERRLKIFRGRWRVKQCLDMWRHLRRYLGIHCMKVSVSFFCQILSVP